MDIPIVIGAFGTTTQAAQTYEVIDKRVRSAFPDCHVLWSYTSHMIKKRVNRLAGKNIINPQEALQKLADQGYRRAVVQPLHILAGHDFSRLQAMVAKARIDVQLGLPLLTHPVDFRMMSHGLVDLLDSRAVDEALVIVGHGTDHPGWTGFFALEHFLREHFRERIFIGCVEQYPSARETVARITGDGFSKICLVPFMMVAGYHFQKELLGDEPDSWKSVCGRAAIDLHIIDRGIGMEPCTSDILISHIQQAIDTIRK